MQTIRCVKFMCVSKYLVLIPKTDTKVRKTYSASSCWYVGQYLGSRARIDFCNNYTTSSSRWIESGVVGSASLGNVQDDKALDVRWQLSTYMTGMYDGRITCVLASYQTTACSNSISFSHSANNLDTSKRLGYRFAHFGRISTSLCVISDVK